MNGEVLYPSRFIGRCDEVRSDQGDVAAVRVALTAVDLRIDPLVDLEVLDSMHWEMVTRALLV